jgi:hypothetical protein
LEFIASDVVLGYFGDGFYLTQYPRYSDYYISGCSLSTRKVQEGNILLCYAALGRPYPVTQNPYKSGGGNEVPEWSLCGKHCGPQCGGADSHDCHYVTVKKDPESSQYYPCPLRQQPDFDEIGAYCVFAPINLKFIRFYFSSYIQVRTHFACCFRVIPTTAQSFALA